MNFKIQLHTDEKEKVEVCDMYWAIGPLSEKYQYKYHVSAIAEKYNLTEHEVRIVVKRYSEMHLKCCRCENYELIQTRTAFSNILNRYYFESVCTDCGEIERKLRSKLANERVKAEKLKKLKKAFLAKRWEGINMDSLEYLIIIAESDSVSEIFKKIFPERDYTTEHGKKKWNRLNYLESLDLIWIERDGSNKILKFHILHKLETILREKHPDLFIQKNKKNAAILEFKLNKDNHLKKYKTKVPLYQNLYLYKDTGYFCQIEILEDGNILFLLKEEE